MVALVSIVVRSMGRKVLLDALDSIASQTWPNLEVVVAAASGPTHPIPPPTCGRHPVRFVPGAVPRERPVAANAGLDAASGEFIGFLDDDDILLPAHVETLAHALQSMPACPAAYSIGREVDAEGRVVRLRAQPFSRLLLHQVCYIVSDALLFRRAALATCRFDEQLDLCEDWDFWIQLAELGDFAFIPVETVVYRAYLGSSDTGRVGQAASERLRRFAAQLGRKWEHRTLALTADVDAEARLAVELFFAGRRIEAEDKADRVLAVYPYAVSALSVKGTLLAQRGNIEEALRHFRTAAQEEPRDPATRLNLAQALDKSGRIDEALAEYDRVLALAPRHPFASERRNLLERRRAGASGKSQ